MDILSFCEIQYTTGTCFYFESRLNLLAIPDNSNFYF